MGSKLNSKSKPKPTTSRRRESPLPLPQGAWAEWGKDAVYFVTEAYDGDLGVDLRAINPNDEKLPVYQITRFSFKAHGIKHGWLTGSCAIVGSRAYVIAEGKMWYCDFAGGSSSSVKWVKGRAPCPPLFDMPHPTLFSMRGNLYALGYEVPMGRNSFQVLLDDGKLWQPMDPPPRPSPDELKLWNADCMYQGSGDGYMPIGVSCIDDSKLILHVPTLEQARIGETMMVNISDENHFLVFEFKGDSIMHGQWTHLRIRPRDSWGCDPCPRAPFPGPSYFPAYRSLLDAGSPLLLPVMPGQLLAFGDSDSSAIRLEFPQEVHIEWPRSKSFFDFESQLNDTDFWHIIHLDGGRYCVIAFPPFHLVPDDNDPLFVFTFDLVISPNLGDGDTYTDSSSSAPSSTTGSSGGSSSRGGSKFTAVNVRSNYRCGHIGIPGRFISGKAYTSSSTTK